MNTVTFDGGVKRQFALPVAIVLGAYSALFFGFVSHPSRLNPIPPLTHEKEYEPMILPQPEEVVAQKHDHQQPNSASQLQRTEITNPILPKPSDKTEITITSETHPMSPIGPMIGPWSPLGGPENEIGTYRPESLDRSPEAVRQPQPVYPLDARIKKECGVVVVAFVVDESGRVLNPRVVSSSDPVFEEPTLRAIERWRFAPGTLRGVPVRFRMSVPVAFNLEG